MEVKKALAQARAFVLKSNIILFAITGNVIIKMKEDDRQADTKRSDRTTT